MIFKYLKYSIETKKKFRIKNIVTGVVALVLDDLVHVVDAAALAPGVGARPDF